MATLQTEDLEVRFKIRLVCPHRGCLSALCRGNRTCICIWLSHLTHSTLSFWINTGYILCSWLSVISVDFLIKFDLIQFLIILNSIDMPYLIFISRIYPFKICILSSWAWAYAKSLQSCLTLNTTGNSLAGSSVHGFSKQCWSGLSCSPPGISWPRVQTRISYVSCIGRRILYH